MVGWHTENQAQRPCRHCVFEALNVGKQQPETESALEMLSWEVVRHVVGPDEAFEWHEKQVRPCEQTQNTTCHHLGAKVLTKNAAGRLSWGAWSARACTGGPRAGLARVRGCGGVAES